MIKLSVYSVKGTKKEAVLLPKNLEEDVNLNLLAQAVRVYGGRRHPGYARVKTRSEVKISTRKIYKQKGTGYARHGAKSAPIFVGGGIAHGPKGVKRVLSLSRKMRRYSLRSALSLRAKEGNLIVVDSLGNLKKTKEAKDFLDKICKEREIQNKNVGFVFILSDKNNKAMFPLRNLKNVKVVSYKDLSANTLYLSGTILLDKEVFSENVRVEKEKLEFSATIDKKVDSKSSKKTKTVKSPKIKQIKSKTSKVKSKKNKNL